MNPCRQLVSLCWELAGPHWPLEGLPMAIEGTFIKDWCHRLLI
jgi:hypothetical protein